MTTKDIQPKDDDGGELDFWRDLGEGWGEVEVELGDKIEWDQLPVSPLGHPTFIGVYTGTVLTDIPDEDTGEIRPVKVHYFKDQRGAKFFSWHSPELDRGLSQTTVGSEVVILWLGKEKLTGVKTMNKFRVIVKAPAL